MTGRAVRFGVVAGLAGVAALTAVEALERAFARRRASPTPGRPLERRRESPGRQPGLQPGTSLALQLGAGTLLGVVRVVMAEQGMRGPLGSFLFLNVRLASDWALERANGVGDSPGGRAIDEQLSDLLRKSVYASTTGAVADRLVAGPARSTAGRRPGLQPGAVRQVHARAGLPKATLRESLGVLSRVMVPTLGKGVIIRRPGAVGMAESLDLDRKAVRQIQHLRNKYGAGPLLMRNPLRPLGHAALILAPEHVHRVLDGSPEPFATETFEKRGALGHFEPRLSLISRGSDRTERVRFNTEVLDTHRPEHRLAESFFRIVDEEAASIIQNARRRGELTWGDFFAPWYRMVRRVVFGDGARDDHELTDMLARLRARGNWSFLAPQDPALRERFLARISSHLERAESNSIANIIAHTDKSERTAPEHQVSQWLFAFDPAAMATYRALALLATHPDRAERARNEIRDSDAAERSRLPFLRACVLESLRLWPTSPMVLRETTRDTQWESGTMPGRSLVLIFAPFFHRDGDRLSYADRFAPELWLNDGSAGELKPLDPEDWPLIPFSSGPGMCPGRHLVLLVASRMLAALLDDRQVRLKQAGRLDPNRPLPGTLDNYTLRFELDRPLPPTQEHSRGAFDRA